MLRSPSGSRQPAVSVLVTVPPARVLAHSRCSMCARGGAAERAEQAQREQRAAGAARRGSAPAPRSPGPGPAGPSLGARHGSSPRSRWEMTSGLQTEGPARGGSSVALGAGCASAEEGGSDEEPTLTCGSQDPRETDAPSRAGWGRGACPPPPSSRSHLQAEMPMATQEACQAQPRGEMPDLAPSPWATSYPGREGSGSFPASRPGTGPAGGSPAGPTPPGRSPRPRP